MKISSKCDKANYPFYDESNHTSKCSKFIDRKECFTSISNRNKVAKKAQLKQKYWFGY